jgi:energy-coupling factor transporter transmembrane protein EcfT
VGGIVLLFLGIVFLLQALDVLPWGLWGTLWRFWPVLIIIIGLNILLRRYSRWVVSILIFALLWACLGGAYWQYAPPAGAPNKSYSEPLSNLDRASIAIDFDGGSLTLGSLAPDSPDLVEVDANTRGGDIEANFHQQNGEGNLDLSAKGIKRFFWSGPWNDWEAALTQNIPLSLDINSSASDISLDLSNLLVTEAVVKLNAGDCKVTAPSSAGTADIKIDANAANVEVTIPTGVAARIQLDTSVTIIDIDKSRFPQSGDYYMSEDFGTSGNQVELNIKCNAGRVQIK